MGYTVDIDPDGSLIPVFNKFFNNDTFTKLGVSINVFGHAYVKMWTNLSLSELAAFLGLIVHMGLINYTGIRCKLWQNTRKGNLFARTVMTNERFEQILKAWHYENYSEYTEEKIIVFIFITIITTRTFRTSL